jgi:hypothetical protein
MIQKKKRRGKWSVELHWTVLEVVSTQMVSTNFPSSHQNKMQVAIWRTTRGTLM